MKGAAMITDQDGPASYEFSYFFGKEEYRSYVAARDARSMRFFGAVGSACVLPFLFLIPYALSTGDISDMVAAVIFILLAVFLVSILVTGRGPWIGSARKSQCRNYLEVHGARVTNQRFFERVALDEDGVAITFGPRGASEGELVTISRAWDAWDRAFATRDGSLLITSREGKKGCFYLMLGYNALLHMARRDQIQDAYVPASALEGADARELAAWARDRIKFARRG